MMKQILFTLLLSLSTGLIAQSWMPVSSGLNDFASELYTDTINNRLLIGGNFTYAGGVFSPFFTSWDGNTYSSIGGGFNNRVRAITMYNGELYVGGNFTMAGDSNIAYLAKWQDSLWVAVDTAINGPVSLLKENNGKLYISGEFSKLDTVMARSVIYNGTSFSTFPGSYLKNKRLWDVETYNFKTYFAFDSTSLIEYNSFVYSTVISGGGSNSQNRLHIYDLEVWNNELYYSGKKKTGQSSAYILGHYDGGYSKYAAAQTCGSFAYGMEGSPTPIIYSIKGDQNYLYAGGDFYEAGCPSSYKKNMFKFQEDVTSVTSNHLNPMGTGTNGYVFDLEFFNNALYIVGNFSEAGNSNSLFISKWDVPAPVASFSTAGSTSICKGDQISYTNTSSSSATSFLWDLPGGTPSSSILHTPTISYDVVGTYDVTLTAAHASGNDTYSQANYITVNALPTVPTISYLGGSFSSSATTANSYEWSVDGQPISGSNSSNFTPIQNGSYTLEITNSDGCKSISNAVSVFDTKITELESSNLFNIFPNPTNGKVNIVFELENNYVINIYDVLNKLVFSQENIKEFDFSVYDAGVYMIVLTSNDLVIKKSLINK